MLNHKCKLFIILSAVVLLSSCSGLHVFSTARSEFDLGLALFNQGKYEEAIPYFQSVTVDDPNHAEAFLYLGRSYMSLSRWKEAISPLRTAYRLSPEAAKNEIFNLLVDSLFAVAIDDFKLGDLDSSADNLREILKMSPGFIKARNKLIEVLIVYGGTLLSQGLFSDAISIYNEVLKLSPNNFDANLGLAKTYFQSGDYAKGFEASQEALRLNPRNQEAQGLISDFLRR